MRRKNLFCITALALAAIAGVQRAQAAVFYGPTPYLSLSDSPLNTSGLGTVFFVEDFEDGALNVTGVTASGGFPLGPAAVFALIDSVDGDDGSIDGSGSNGWSYYSNGLSTLTFTFDAGALGSLPLQAGLVMTDIGFSSPVDGVADVIFEAFDAGNVSLGTIGPDSFGDGLFGGQTAEDRFFGVSHAGGISRISVTVLGSNDWEMDHLQFGLKPIPEPASCALLGLGALLVLARPRRGFTA